MKIKIGNTIYDSKHEPIMVILSEKDKENIKNMDINATKYCEYNEENTTIEEAEMFMYTEE